MEKDAAGTGRVEKAVASSQWPVASFQFSVFGCLLFAFSF
jgi:hypothetical protein